MEKLRRVAIHTFLMILKERLLAITFARSSAVNDEGILSAGAESSH